MSVNNFMETNGESVSNKVVYAKMVTGVPFKFRVATGEILRSYTYWVKNAKGKELPFENLSFSRENEKFNSGEHDPVRAQGLQQYDATAKKMVPLKSKRSYKVMIINRATGAVECLDLKKSIFDGMVKFIKENRNADGSYPDVTDFEWVVDRTGQKWNEVKYDLNVMATLRANKPEALAEVRVNDEDLIASVKTIDELFPRETPEEQEARLIKHLTARDEESENDQGGEQPSGDEGLSDLDD